MFPVDFLHEVELGVWKAVFKHILRILHMRGTKAIADFNHRFRLVPTFGRGTIRKFTENVSEMTRPAARNYEDVLQCCIPVLEGLLPPSYESRVMQLLFVLARWHALAKLRLHSEATLAALDKETRTLGRELRQFREYTAATATFETPQECAARVRRSIKTKHNGNSDPQVTEALETPRKCDDRARRRLKTKTGDNSDPPMPPAPKSTQSPRPKKFNIDTCKIHFLGDYVESIAHFGTTDSTSTQTGELHHRRVKRRYMRTNKDKPLPQITRMERIEANLGRIREQLGPRPPTAPPESVPDLPPRKAQDNESMPMPDAGRAPYSMAQSQKNPITLSVCLEDHKSDPAFKEFILRLKNHLLARILGEKYQEEATHTRTQLEQLVIQNNRIYQHAKIKINYTSYDVRRCQDVIRPSTPKCFALIPSAEDANAGAPSHPFWYAKVLGVYHANVIFNSPAPRRIDFLWVRWLGRNLEESAGWRVCRMDNVGYFADTALNHAFDFVDPTDVIRAAHLIPRFATGRTFHYLGVQGSLALDDSARGDWDQYYVNRFVDRDMFMRYMGSGIGHLNRTAPKDNIPSVQLPTTAGEESNGVQGHSSTLYPNEPSSLQPDDLPYEYEEDHTSSEDERDVINPDEGGSDMESLWNSDSEADDYEYNV